MPKGTELNYYIQMFGDNNYAREMHEKFKDLPKPVLKFDNERFMKNFIDRIKNKEC